MKVCVTDFYRAGYFDVLKNYGAAKFIAQVVFRISTGYF